MVCSWYAFPSAFCPSANCRNKRHAILVLLFGASLLAAGCTDNGAAPADRPSSADASLVRAAPQVTELQILNRVTWGESSSSAIAFKTAGRAAFLRDQLHPKDDIGLPDPVRDQIASLTISREPLPQLVSEINTQRDAANKIADPDQKKAAQKVYQDAVNGLGNQAVTRSLLRDLYAQDQLKEQMVWFWMNHFNVNLGKSDIRILVGDYEEHAIRPHALGKFRDLLSATLHHPAMLRYLDNDQNAAGHINENYAREIMELHTMGVGSGYTQKDVQELARILTGVGVNETTNMPKVNPKYSADYIRDGLFEFNPNRHDYGPKQFLGHAIAGAGLKEVDAALDLIAGSPATAHFISRKLAVAFVSDAPPESLVARMTSTFQHSDGDIAATMQTLFDSKEFAASLGAKFKDPMHYAISAVRLAYDARPILNTAPVVNWLNRMAEPLYGHDTPDGYPLTAAAWSGPGQMATRFEIARAIGSGSAGLFRPDGQTVDQPAFPQVSNALYYGGIEPMLTAATRQSLSQANSPQDWNTLFLSSPDFMYR
jgi:uncharacterized protein (DUF1800 family)